MTSTCSSDRATPARRMVLPVVALLVALALMASACGTAAERRRSASSTCSRQASLTEAFTQLGEDFTAAHPDVKISFNFAGSNDLVAQLRTRARRPTCSPPPTRRPWRRAGGDT